LESVVFRLKPSLRVTVTLKDFGQRPIDGASILVDRTRSKQVFYTSQNIPSFCAFHLDTTFSSAERVSGWLRERNLGGVTGELRRLGLKLGGFNHCGLHCHLARFRSLVIRGKYRAVIGRKTFCFCMHLVTISRLRVLLSQSQRRMSP
jgi:hypothetical protein